jgi:hypothetical protein
LALAAIVTLAAVPLLSAIDAHGNGDVYRRWISPKSYSCTDAGGHIDVHLTDQDVEFNSLPVDAQFTINYIDNGVNTPSGPFTVEQTSGTKNYGSFTETFPSYPLTFDFRLDTLIDGEVVYQSNLHIACAADATGTVSATNQTIGTGDPYRRWISPKSYSCTDVGGHIDVHLTDQNVEFNNLPVDAQYTINYIDNGVNTPSGPFTVEQTSGTKNYGSFTETFPSYPLTFDFRLDTLIDGVVVYQSNLHIACAADTTGTVSATNVVVTATTPPVTEAPVPDPVVLVPTFTG